MEFTEMNKQQLQQDIETMKQRLASMEAELNKKPVSKVFIPKDGETYYFTLSNGVLAKGVFCPESFTDATNSDMGNCYRTREDAEKARDKQLSYVRVTRKLRELEGDWVADWRFNSQDKSTFYFYTYDNKFRVTHTNICISTDKSMYSTHKACQWVIDNMEADLK